MNFDVIVVGGGHAGCEASHVCAKKGLKTAMFCMSFSHVGNMPCNPSIGGSAKGIVVKEIDALGGIMGLVADRNALQFKMLNLSKGPGVHALRTQEDKITYPKDMLETLRNTNNLTLIEKEVVELIVEDKVCTGVRLVSGEEVRAKAVILTTGTYLEADILRGSSRVPEGPDGDKRSHGLSESLRKNGISLFRLKTGTPPRIKKNSIDFSVLEEQLGSNMPLAFSFDTTERMKIEDEVKCYLTYTNEKTHQIIEENLHKSAMYGGYVKGVGPRYCPSIEDKIVRFKDKPRHQLFIEPESLYTDSYYLQGFSTSMPKDVQEKMVHSLKGLENAEILKFAYAIEYDAIEPSFIDYSLNVRGIKGLYAAGQVIGTSGYEEAAALGLMAGINASQYILSKKPFILKRSEAYIGVMIDDLVTKGTHEPYRLLSSRSEFRLMTRSDNALERLFMKGYELGINSEERKERFVKRQELLSSCRTFLENTRVGKTKEVLDLLEKRGLKLNDPNSKSLYDLIKTRKIDYKDLANIYTKLPKLDFDEEMSLVISIQYEGYIKLEEKEAERLLASESFPLDNDIDYMKIDGLSMEAREKLNAIKPKNIGEASRITNVHPSDISVLLLYLKGVKKN